MEEKQWVLIASTDLSAKKMKSAIAKYWCRRDEENCIDISFKEDECPPYKVYQDGVLMVGYRVITRGGRYRFEGKE